MLRRSLLLTPFLARAATPFDDAIHYAEEHNSTGLVVIHKGRLVTENYWKGWTRDSSGPIFSASKSITSTLIGMAIEDGKIRGVGQSMADFVPGWKGTPKEAITIGHALSMTSGIKVGADAAVAGVDQFAQTAALPLEHEPGTHWAYNTPVYRMLLRVLEKATGEPLAAYTKRKLTAPLGMEHGAWDGLPANGETSYTWFRCTVRDMARFGELVLGGGEFQGKRLINAKWLAEAQKPSQPLNPAYGYLWWLNGQKAYQTPAGRLQLGMLWPDCPPDAVGALGALDKKIFVVPSLDLVVARHGGAAGVQRALGPNQGFDNQLLSKVCRAVSNPA